MNKLSYEWMHEWMKEYMNKLWPNEWMNGWMNEWINEWMNEWMDEWINEWMNEWMNRNFFLLVKNKLQIKFFSLSGSKLNYNSRDLGLEPAADRGSGESGWPSTACSGKLRD